MTLDVESIRNQFPILQRTLPNGKKLVYFDNAATSQKPLAVIDAMSDFYKNYHANAHRANHTLADESTACLLYTSPSPRDYAASRMPSSA